MSDGVSASVVYKLHSIVDPNLIKRRY